MTNAELVELIAADQGLTRKSIDQILRCAFGHIKTLVLVKKKRVSIPDFGVFKARTRAQRRVKDLMSGELIVIPHITSVGFSAAGAAKKRSGVRSP